MADPRENKLPSWAQQIIQGLRINLAASEVALAAARAEAPARGASGKVMANSYSECEFPLQDESTIEFSLPNGKIRAYLRPPSSHNNDGPVLDINGDSTIRVYPRAANSVYITLEDG